MFKATGLFVPQSACNKVQTMHAQVHLRDLKLSELVHVYKISSPWSFAPRRVGRKRLSFLPDSKCSLGGGGQVPKTPRLLHLWTISEGLPSRFLLTCPGSLRYHENKTSHHSFRGLRLVQTHLSTESSLRKNTDSRFEETGRK